MKKEANKIPYGLTHNGFPLVDYMPSGYSIAKDQSSYPRGYIVVVDRNDPTKKAYWKP